MSERNNVLVALQKIGIGTPLTQLKGISQKMKVIGIVAQRFLTHGDQGLLILLAQMLLS
jgi:hypothetical protein